MAVPLGKFTTEFQRCLAVSGVTGHLEVVSRRKRHCLFSSSLGKFTTGLERC